MSDPVARRWAIAITALYIVLAAMYSVATPVFEASDEISHYPVVEHIATTGRLPVQQPGVKTLWEQEGSQPPLYYLLAAALTFWIDTGDLETVLWRNPHAKLGVTLDPDNKNMIIHTEAEKFPWQRAVLAVHMIRFFSVALGSITVFLTYLLAREVFPDDYWVAFLAAILAALNPMFLFISGSVNNDNLTIPLSTACILLGVRVVKRGIATHRIAALAVLLSLGAITKISGLTLIPFVGLVLVLRARRNGEWRTAVFAGAAIAGVWLIIAGWWYARNLVLYGELLGLNTHVAIAGARDIDLLTLITQEWYGFWVSYWALFGAVNILANGQVYFFYGLLSLIALVGLIVWLRRQIQRRDWQALLIPALLAVQIAIVLGGVIRWTMSTYASQGRLMFSVIAPISTLLAFGILQMEAEPWRKHVVLAMSVFLLLAAGLSPFLFISPAYSPPPIVSEIPTTAAPIYADFGGLELVAAETYSVTAQEGRFVPITLYWRAMTEIDENYSIYLHALGRDNAEIGKIDSYPGGGLLPTTRMVTDAIIRDDYWLELDPSFDAPTAVRIQVGVGRYDDKGFNVIDPVLTDGQTPSSVTLHAGVAYPSEGCKTLADRQTPLAMFGDFAVIWIEPFPAAVHPGDSIPIALLWDRRAETAVDWTVFVQLVDEGGAIYAQADGQPLGGFYPTSMWRMSCQVEDMHILRLPSDIAAGTYEILVGLYDAADPSYRRAPVVNESGSPYPNDAVSLGPVRVLVP